MRIEDLRYYQELWTIRSHYYYHKVPTYIEEKGEITLEYKKVEPVYVWRKNIDWNQKETWDVCPVDFSKPENKEKSWEWSLTVNDFIGKSYFFTKEEALKKFNEISQATRDKYEEIEQLKRLSN